MGSLAMAPPSGKTPKTVLDKVCAAIIALDQVGAHIDHLRANATLCVGGCGWSACSALAQRCMHRHTQ
jgi:hypothetical protein